MLSIDTLFHLTDVETGHWWWQMLGDRRAVLCDRGKAIEMSRDHKPVCVRERRRIEASAEPMSMSSLMLPVP